MVTRRDFLHGAALASAAGVVASCSREGRAMTSARAAGPRTPPAPVELPALFDRASEREETKMPSPVPPDRRVGVAVVGLGRLSLEEIIPALAQSKWCRLAALVSGDHAKAEKVASQWGVPGGSIYDYASYGRLRDDEAVELVYVVLPNSQHAEFTVKAFEAGKHVLCEKPMANTVVECQQMIAAGTKAKKHLMIAYRLQYEPHHRELIRAARAGELGALKGVIATNGQAQGTPAQWRLKKALAGGGALPDIGIYCLNAARYLTGEEPIAVSAMIQSTPNDPRFAEVEESVAFTLRFPSGVLASCSTSYGAHQTKSLRLLGATGWAEIDPAFSYEGLRLRTAKKQGDHEAITELRMQAPNQFAQELDHAARCILEDKRPDTPGEEGLRDIRLMASIYEAASSGRTLQLAEIPRP